MCDGNINTFRHLSEKHQVPIFLIDVPQLQYTGCKSLCHGTVKELIAMLEDTFHRC
ncbi:MAG: 2-hydroxyacyl-CoA dehydratase family protein [Eubacterium ramulus]